MQNVKTPRIYVDYLSWLSALGFDVKPDNIGVGFNVDKIYSEESTVGAESICNFGWSGDAANEAGYRLFPKELKLNFMSVLGHNFSNALIAPHFHIKADDDGYTNSNPDKSNIANCGAISGPTFIADYDGFSIMELIDGSNFSVDGQNTDILLASLWINSGQDFGEGFNFKVGSWAIGSFYDFPHSPDLSLTMSIENDGITTQQTTGGSTLTNMRYSGPPKWGSDLGAWELGDGSTASTLGARTGRRVWNLTFSYLTDKNVLPINALGNTVFDINNASSYDSTDYSTDSTQFESNVLDGSDFFSSVWSKTMGVGNLPFIFQPDKDNNSPDQFAICRWDMNSLQVRQTSPSLYSISLIIKECW